MVFYDSNRKESRTGGKPGGHQMPELWKSLHSQSRVKKTGLWEMEDKKKIRGIVKGVYCHSHRGGRRNLDTQNSSS